jgi:hypothetical protein
VNRDFVMHVEFNIGRWTFGIRHSAFGIRCHSAARSAAALKPDVHIYTLAFDVGHLLRLPAAAGDLSEFGVGRWN